MRGNIWPLLNKLYFWPEEAWECFWQEEHEVEMRTRVQRPETLKVSASHRVWQSKELRLGRGSAGFSTQVNSSRTTRSAEAKSPCNSHLFLPSTNQACGSSYDTLDRVSSSRRGQTDQGDVSLAKGIHENSRETFPPSQPPPVAPGESPSLGPTHQP